MTANYVIRSVQVKLGGDGRINTGVITGPFIPFVAYDLGTQTFWYMGMATNTIPASTSCNIFVEAAGGTPIDWGSLTKTPSTTAAAGLLVDPSLASADMIFYYLQKI